MDTSKPIGSHARVRKAKPETSAVGRWNGEMLKRLTNALKENPEADMVALLTPTYSKKLQSFQAASAVQRSKKSAVRPAPHRHDIRSRFNATDPSTIIFTLSAKLEALFHKRLNLSENLVNLLADSEVLYESDWAATVVVFKLNEDMVVKVTSDGAALIEHRTLTYLQEHLPSFPAPRPHGLARFGHFHLLFTTFIPGQDLEKVWPELNNSQKQSIADQLGTLFTELRLLPHPDATPLGSVLEDGCRDLRRDVRMSAEPITTDQEFQDFLFAGSKTATASYIRFMRDLVPKFPTKIVFTHGDVRPANIIVHEDKDENWRIVSVIDWEASGFYPEYWECVKATNNMTPRDDTDWYQYLPGPISPGTYPTHWLIDRVWDRSMINS